MNYKCSGHASLLSSTTVHPVSSLRFLKLHPPVSGRAFSFAYGVVYNVVEMN